MKRRPKCCRIRRTCKLFYMIYRNAIMQLKVVVRVALLHLEPRRSFLERISKHGVLMRCEPSFDIVGATLKGYCRIARKQVSIVVSKQNNGRCPFTTMKKSGVTSSKCSSLFIVTIFNIRFRIVVNVQCLCRF